MRSADTIAAVATAPGRGGIGVVRVSGKNIASLVTTLVGRELPPRRALLCEFRNGKGEAVDSGIALYFPAPHSYTGEEVLELQGHGGPVVVSMVLQSCLEAGARLAEPGEFTQRAFFNGKLDLAQAESVADLIDASTRSAARSAMRSLQGDFSQEVHTLVAMLIELRMLAEATIDFPEEEIDFLEETLARSRLAEILTHLDRLLGRARQGKLLRDGLQVVLAGKPNVGKSSLLNRLAEEEVAIVTEIPGTTRDPIRQFLEIEGIPLHIVDTAGLRETEEQVEKIGIDRARREIGKADLILFLSVEEEPQEEILGALEIPLIRIRNKIDLHGGEPAIRQTARGTEVSLSAKTGAGVDLLKKAVLEAVGWQETGEGLFIARARHLEALQDARNQLLHAESTIGFADLFAEDLRLAQNALSRITGEFGAEELLGEIFSRFCIGK